MKKFTRLLALLLALLLVMPFAVACSGDGNGDTPAATTTDPSTPPTPDDNDKYADIAGEYLLDASNLGMPMKWYIKIAADGKFVISTTREYTSLKGDGTVGNSGDTYMFLYSDSTNETPKTATFKFEGANIVFSTSVPIGSASVSPSAEENLFPVAKKIAHEDILGTYAGKLDKTTGMGTVPYTFEVVLGYGLEYTFSSTFSMMGTSMTLTESGTFAIDGEKIAFTATTRGDAAVETPAAVEGTLVGNKITAPFKLSQMASAADTVEMTFATYADVAGTYSALISLMGGMATYEGTLVLDAFGGYTYTTTDFTDGTVQYSEEGSFTVEGDKIVLTSSADGATAVEGTIDNFTVAAKLRISTAVPMSTNVTFYSEAVSGLFAATATTEGGVEYAAALVLIGNTYSLAVAKGEAVVYTCVGTFEIQKGMVTSLVLTADAVYSGSEISDDAIIEDAPDEVKVISAPVSDTALNANLIFDLDDTATLGFSFVK